ncbi:uncharacterized protein LOC133496185 isoform X1 [Syngnathoides biaculeatus]|uniref:uncharacterized protein LOC133496185 isoform X1 n=1 Tax=Syngnathoides biaculeatus TaxID=300417 RepID=UPI002ADE1EAD|nr:uncharacterized protein LOC133496185 isoform X1 [Syngnathoides biaculeatus]XP_061667416.1 uncharacterized protein LOC133496185 isoform X1 [Syngnathoides biaculeatus]XP_061667417.1 uncharacterized protein LOC133496185 isoform X1 [Syngnathoides biaculeatus]XP_061667418.1 uncharacterized protein LOC133496185 isoform X1 [Syngnathoides biaculeatus]XP_061667419.1 uncharacterized protein LOC133496185 isoform X1 [Syngnathoides biaculeatus]
MDWFTSLAACIVLLWIFCFIDGNAVLELRLLFHALTKAACHLYLALLPLRRAAVHFSDCARHLLAGAQRQDVAPPTYPQPHGAPPVGRACTLHLLEGACVLCETMPNLMAAVLSVGAALCHGLQGAAYVLAATLRAIQLNLFSQMNGPRQRPADQGGRAARVQIILGAGRLTARHSVRYTCEKNAAITAIIKLYELDCAPLTKS